jgi:hypothetical protein
MGNYFLKQDKIIGHELIVDKELFRKKFSLETVYYNDLISEIIDKIDEVLPEHLYHDIHFLLREKIWENRRDLSPLENKKRLSLKKRIDSLQFKFRNFCLEKALKILEENKNLS